MKRVIIICILFWISLVNAQTPIKLKEPSLLYGNIDTNYYAIVERPVTNREYLIYLEWLRNVYSPSYPNVFYKAIPTFQFPKINSGGELDVKYKRKDPYEFVLMCTEPFVKDYMFNPKYLDYPVIGVSWGNANNYCQWFADRYNEMKLIDKKYLGFVPNPTDQDYFSTVLYLLGLWQGQLRKKVQTKNDFQPERDFDWNDNIFISAFRLPTSYELNKFQTYRMLDDELKAYPFTKKNVLYEWEQLYLHNVCDTSFEVGLKEVHGVEKITEPKTALKFNILTKELVLDINNKNNSIDLFEIYNQNNQHQYNIDSLKNKIAYSHNDFFKLGDYDVKYMPIIMLDNGYNSKMVLVDNYKEPLLSPVKEGFYSVFRMACSIHKEETFKKK